MLLKATSNFTTSYVVTYIDLKVTRTRLSRMLYTIWHAMHPLITQISTTTTNGVYSQVTY